MAGLGVGLQWHWSQRQTTGEPRTGSRSLGIVTTDAEGRFTFSHLPAGSFQYGVFSPTNQYVSLEAPLVISKADSQKSLRIVVSTGSHVTGRVVDGQTGRPMGGVYVGAGLIPPGGDLTKWTYWKMPSEGKTDAHGHYEVRVTPGNVFVGVGRISDNFLFSQRIRDAAERVSVRPGQTVSAPDIPVFLHPIIVCVGPDGQPVARTTFRITPDDMKKDGYIVDDHTDATGTVVLDRGDSGSFRITRDGRTASGSFQWSPNRPLVIRMDGQTFTYPSGVGKVQLTEGSAALVTGSVVSENGSPIPNALVRIVETDPRSHYALEDHLFRTDASGVFRAPLDPNGQYHVHVRADGFNQVSLSDTPLNVVKGATVNLGAVHLVRADGSVSGRVVDRLGKPMAGVLAFVRGEKTLVSAAMTDDRGFFRIPNVVSDEVLHLDLCLKGEVSDSGVALSQSNDEMHLPGVKASPIVRQIVWNPER